MPSESILEHAKQGRLKVKTEQTSPPLRVPSLLGEDAERNFDHPSYPPL